MPDDDKPNGRVTVSAVPIPFLTAPRALTVEAGMTVAGIVGSLGLPVSPQVAVYVGGHEIPFGDWRRVTPPAGSALLFVAVPCGGGGRDGGKDVLRTVATIALLAGATALLGPAGLGFKGAGLAFGVGVTTAVGSLAVNALIPPSRVNDVPALLSSEPGRPAFALTGSGNRANPFGVVPQVLGKHRMFPTYGALPFTEARGDEQFLRLLFVLGYGELEITELKIGETDIDQFDVDYEVRTGADGDAPVTLYTQDINEQNLSILLPDDEWVTQTTKAGTDFISLDVLFTQGLFDLEVADALGNRGGRPTELQVIIDGEYRPAGETGSWTPLTGSGNPIIKVQANSLSPVRQGSALVPVTNGQYDVRLKKRPPVRVAGITTPGSDTVVWSALRSVTNTPPITVTGLALVAIRIKATDQLNGVIDNFNCVAQTVTLDWDGAAWVKRATSNPASLYRHVLQGKANKNPVADDRIDLAELQAWHAANAAAGRGFNFVVDTPGTVFDRLADITSVGRASFNMSDGKFSVVRDVAQVTPVQVFTPANSSGYSGSKVFIDPPHGIKVRYINPAAGWTQDEVVAYDDGFTESNATKFETLTLLGVTDATQAWKDGRYFLAASRLRPELHELTVDAEHLVCTRGDLVRLHHDVPLLGVGHGRVKTVVNTSGTVWQITLNNTWSADTTFGYRLLVRRPDGAMLSANAVNVTVGEHTTIDYDEAVAGWGEQPEAGDLVVIGLTSSVGVDMIVKSIEPGADLSAKLVLVDAAPAVHTADTGTIPQFDPQVTAPGIIFPLLALAPVIDSVRSDIAVGQSGQVNAPRIVVTLGLPHVRYADFSVDHYEVQVRETSDTSGAWAPRPDVPGASRQITLDGVWQGTAYDIRIRAISRIGRVSDWATIANHTVIGSDHQPPDVINTRLDGPWLTWEYPDPPYDLAGFKVRFTRAASVASDWPAASSAHENIVTENYFNLFDIIDDTTEFTFLVKAIDSDGNESAAAATAVINLGDTRSEPFFESDRRSYHTEGFPGTVTGGTVTAGVLEADLAAGTPLFWKNTNTPFWSNDPTKKFWSDTVTLYKELVYTFTFVPPAMVSNRNTRFILELTTEGDTPVIEFRQLGDAPFWANDPTKLFWTGSPTQLFWTPVTNPFKPWRGTVRNFKRMAYEMRITIPGSANRPKISHVAVVAQGGVNEEFFEDVPITSAGTRLALSRAYNGISQVVVSLQDDGGLAVNVLVVDKDPTLGPKLKAVDKDGGAVAATIDASIKGF